MGKLLVFSSISLDGYFTDANGDMDWAHRSDSEWDGFVAANARDDGTLLFGRVTYEQMSSFWPTAAARQMAPDVAKGMNQARKVVFSRSLKKATWSNTRLVRDGLLDAVRALKHDTPQDLVVLGSGTIVSQLAQADLIDEYQTVLVPIVLGAGRTLYEGLDHRQPLQLTQSRAFGNGNVVLWHRRSST
ncbi:MAG TPA: dihydrofolate reductase family protein [Rhizobacter sp.]|nr:dihydrofolate reductase family protein [Rhizobacter sp.]